MERLKLVLPPPLRPIPDWRGSCPDPGVGPRVGRVPGSSLGSEETGAQGRWSCHLTGECGRPGPGRDRGRETAEGESPSGGVVMGTRGGGEELRGVMAGA